MRASSLRRSLCPLAPPLSAAARAPRSREAIRVFPTQAVFADPVVRQNLMRIGFVYGFILITVNALYGLMAADSMALWKIDANDRLDWASVQANIPWDAIVAVTVVYIPVSWPCGLPRFWLRKNA